MKRLLSLLTLLLLTACIPSQKERETKQKESLSHYIKENTICIHGVEYYREKYIVQGGLGITVLYNPDGTLRTCQ